MNFIEKYLICQNAPRRVKNVYERLVDTIDENRANRVINFIEKFCRHSKGAFAGKPFQLLPFQKAFISALFGSVDATTGERRFKESFLYMGRKNGKTELAAALALYMLIADNEAGAEVYTVATKYDQARLCFDEALNMVRLSPALSRVLKKRQADLYYPKTLSKFKALGSNASTFDGLNASFVIVDECHALKNRDVYDVMKLSQSARAKPLFLTITTAGMIRENIFDDLYSYSCKVADGIIEDNSFLPVLYELEEKEEYKNPTAWIKANPALEVIKKKSDLEQKIKRAENSPAELNAVLCYDFNIISNVTSAWLSWEDIKNEETFSFDDISGCYAIGGVDLSMTTDLTCATLLIPKNEKLYVIQMYWLPVVEYEKRKGKKIPFEKWHDLGLLRLCNGSTINPSDVVAWFVEMYQNFNIIPLWTYYDSYSSRYFVDEMEAHSFKMVRCIQGAKTLSNPMRILGAELAAKKINYNNNPLLKWCLANVNAVEDRNANILPVKRSNPEMRIDGFASLLDAFVGYEEHKSEMKGLS